MRSTGEGNGKPLQYSCLENPMNSMKRQKDRTLKDELLRSVGAQYAVDREAWCAAVHGITKSRTWLATELNWTELYWTDAILFFIASDFASITNHIYSWALFWIRLQLSFLFGVISPLISSSILGGSFFSVVSFCLFIVFMGFSRQEYWSGLLFLPPVDHILSELSTMTHPY